MRVEVGRYPFPTVVGESGTGGEWFESVRRALRWNTRGAVQGGFGSRVNAGEMDEVEEEGNATKEHEGGEEEEEEEEEGEEWDIDTDPFDEGNSGEVGARASEAGNLRSGHATPLREADPEPGLD